MRLRLVSGAETLALFQPSFERRIAKWGTGSYPGCLFERREPLGLQLHSLFEGSTATPLSIRYRLVLLLPCPVSSWNSSSATPSTSSLSHLLRPVSLTHWHAVVDPSSLFLHPSSLVLGTDFFADAIEYSPSLRDRTYLPHVTGRDPNSSSNPSQAGPIRSALQPVLFVGRRTLLKAIVGSLSDFKIVEWLFVPALLSGLLPLVVVVVARRLFTARAARRWEAIDMDPYYDMDARGPPYGNPPQPSVPPGYRNAPPREFLEVTSELPSFVRNSPNWRSRCEWDPSRRKVTPPGDLSFTLSIKQRLRLMGLD